MTNRRYLPGPPVALAAAVLAIVLLVSCTGTKQNPPGPTAPPPQKVLAVFAGPWGFAPDPDDPNSVIAMAPATAAHHNLYVKASYNEELTQGVYTLSMPPRTVTPAGTIIPDIVQTKIDPNAVRRVVNDNHHDRYAVRIPKPEAYIPEDRYLSSVGTVPHPAAHGIAAKPWATGVSLQYTVGSLSTFQVTGTPDSGNFPAFPLQLDTPLISFIITPLHEDDPSDLCYTHDRQAFQDLTALLGVTLFVDFAGPSGCDMDEKKKPSTRAQLALPPMARMAAFEAYPAGIQEAGIIPASWLNSLTRAPIRILTRSVVAAFYFFASPTGDCKSPIIVGG